MRRAPDAPRFGLLLSLTLIAALSCTRDASMPSDPAVQYAKGGGSPTGGPTVSATDPTSAHQDTTLDVRVIGSGFDNGSRVSFAIRGVTSTKVVASSTSYVSSTELIARVTVAADADTVKHDVVVVTLLGKKGIGSELFTINSSDASTSWLFPTDATGLAVVSDGAFASGGYSVYENRVCGVDGMINSYSTSGDNTLYTDVPGSRDRKCAAYPRKLTLIYPDGVRETGAFRANIQQLESGSYAIAIGATVKRGLNLSVSTVSTRCGSLRYKGVMQDGILIAADSVLVTRLDGQTWEVTTQPYPNDRGYCPNTGNVYHMPLRFRVVATWPY